VTSLPERLAGYELEGKKKGPALPCGEVDEPA
jgi:hypothetical protein